MKVLLGDDQPMFSAVLGQLLTDAGHTVLEGGLSVGAAIEMCSRADADVCLLGLDSTPLSALAPLSELISRHRVALVLLLPRRDRSIVKRAGHLRVSGIAIREEEFATVLRTVTEAVEARRWPCDVTVLSPGARAIIRDRETDPAGPRLTSREEQILRRLAAGQSASAVAEAIGVRVTTVRSHVASVFRKLGAHTMVEAVAIARRTGLLDNRDPGRTFMPVSGGDPCRREFPCAPGRHR